MLLHGLGHGCGRIGERYAPKSVVISAPLENGGCVGGDRDVIVVVDCCSFVAFVEDGDISIVGKGADTEERVG